MKGKPIVPSVADDECDICGGRAVAWCRCILSHRICSRGHSWYWKDGKRNRGSHTYHADVAQPETKSEGTMGIVIKTITVQIGNSDNRLPQVDWSQFYHSTEDIIKAHAHRVHFSGTSHPADPWQNAAWVFAPGEDTRQLKRDLAALCSRFGQDSIALTEGETEFIMKAGPPLVISALDCPVCGQQMIFNSVWGTSYCQECGIGGYVKTEFVADAIAAAKGKT